MQPFGLKSTEAWVGGSLNFVAKAGAPPFAGELRSERQLGTLSVGCQRIKAASRHGSLKTGAFARPCLLYLDTHVTRSRNSPARNSLVWPHDLGRAHCSLLLAPCSRLATSWRYGRHAWRATSGAFVDRVQVGASALACHHHPARPSARDRHSRRVGRWW